MKQRGRKSAASIVFGRPQLVPPAPPPEVPELPRHLGDREQQIWRDVLREWRGTDASLALLTSGLESHMRARECREVINREGMVLYGGRDDQAPKPHPLLTAERAAHRAFAQVFRQLNIKV